jgi:shikimate dehydrogenase
MKKFAVIGWPLHHSLSPEIHNPALKACAVQAIYEKVEINPVQFDKSVIQLKKEYYGFNITIPYKQLIMDYLDRIDDQAAAVGAVNTAAWRHGSWIGYNTDINGFIKPLLKIKKPLSKVLLLGSGGASRAILYALLIHSKPQQIWLAARTPEKAEKLAADFSMLCQQQQSTLEICPFKESVKYCAESNLIINCTPVGTTPEIMQSPLPGLKKLMDQAVVYDLVYNPQETRLLQEAKTAGKEIITINGLEMLIEQAAEAFTIWTGMPFPYKIVRNHLTTTLNDKYVIKAQ